MRRTVSGYPGLTQWGDVSALTLTALRPGSGPGRTVSPVGVTCYSLTHSLSMTSSLSYSHYCLALLQDGGLGERMNVGRGQTVQYGLYFHC